MAGRGPVPQILSMPDGSDKPPLSLPCPPHLDEIAAAKWAEVVPRLEALGVIQSTDTDMVELYCVLWSEMQLARDTLQKDGYTVSAGQGGKKGHPAISHFRGCAVQLRTLAAGLGLSPEGRARLKVKPPQKPGSGVATRKRG